METIGWIMNPDVKSKVIYETNNYALVVTNPGWISSDHTVAAYCIMNKEHEVIESTGNSLPVMYKAIAIFETNMEEALKMIREENSNAFTVVQLRKDSTQ